MILNVGVVIREFDDRLGLGANKTARNKAVREALYGAAAGWRAKFYARRFDRLAVYAPPFNYQWTKYDRKGREKPINTRSPFLADGTHRKLYMKSVIKATATSKKAKAEIPIWFGHPIPKRVPTSPAIDELLRVATYIAPDEFEQIVKWVADGIATRAAKIPQTRPKQYPQTQRRKRVRPTVHARSLITGRAA